VRRWCVEAVGRPSAEVALELQQLGGGPAGQVEVAFFVAAPAPHPLPGGAVRREGLGASEGEKPVDQSLQPGCGAGGTDAVGDGLDDLLAGEGRSQPGQTVWPGEEGVERLLGGRRGRLVRFLDATDAGVHLVRAEPEGAGLVFPLGDEVVGIDAVFLGLAGGQGGGLVGPGGGVAGLGDHGLDLVPPLGERLDHLVGDPVDLGPPLVDLAPLDAEPLGEQVAEVGLARKCSASTSPSSPRDAARDPTQLPGLSPFPV